MLQSHQKSILTLMLITLWSSITPSENTIHNDPTWQSTIKNYILTWNAKKKSCIELQENIYKKDISTNQAICKKNHFLTLAHQHEHGGILDTCKCYYYQFQALNSEEKYDTIMSALKTTAFFAALGYVIYKIRNASGQEASKINKEEQENEEPTLLTE